jgi:hypothetical protein
MATSVTLNQTVTKNPDQMAGGDFGMIVGTRPTHTIGFYGNEGVVQQPAPTDVAGVIALLKALGLCAGP